MAAAPPNPSIFLSERKTELIHSTNALNPTNLEFIRSVEILHKAQADLFSDMPEHQHSALCSILMLSNQYGFGESSLPPKFFMQVKELAFGNHASRNICDSSLELVESLIERSKWTIPHFLKFDFHKIIFEFLKNRNSEFPLDRLAFILNSFMTHSDSSFTELLYMGYFDFLFALTEIKLTNFDIHWILTSIQTISTSPYFSYLTKETKNSKDEIVIESLEERYIPKIVKISLKYFDSSERYILTLVFGLFSRCLAFSDISKADKEKITTEKILHCSFELIENKGLADIAYVFDFVDNYVCLSEEATMKFISVGFLPVFLSIFIKCDYKYQIKILDICANVAIAPIEATLYVLSSPFLRQFLPEMLRTGKLALKKSALHLCLNLVFKAPFNQDLWDFLKSIFGAVIDLLACEDDEILEHSLSVMGYLATKLQTLEMKQSLEILNAFDKDTKEMLYELTESENKRIQGMSSNIIKTLDLFCLNNSIGQ